MIVVCDVVVDDAGDAAVIVGVSPVCYRGLGED